MRIDPKKVPGCSGPGAFFFLLVVLVVVVVFVVYFLDLAVTTSRLLKPHGLAAGSSTVLPFGRRSTLPLGACSKLEGIGFFDRCLMAKSVSGICFERVTVFLLLITLGLLIDWAAFGVALAMRLGVGVILALVALLGSFLGVVLGVL